MQLGRKLGDVVERTLLCEVVKLLEGTVVFLRHEGQGLLFYVVVVLMIL